MASWKNLDTLPEELIGLIGNLINLDDLLKFCRASKKFSYLCHNPQFWKNLIYNIRPRGFIPDDFSVPNLIWLYKQVVNQGRLYTLGESHIGCLGLGNTILQRHPALVLPGNNIIQVSCGGTHTAAVTNDGQVYIWGSNHNGQLGIGEAVPFQIINTPFLVPNISNAIQVSCGTYSTAVVTEDGQVYTLGKNGDGLLGFPGNHIYPPTRVPGLEKERIIQVSCASYHMAMVTSKGQVYVCGSNSWGKMGLGFGGSYDHPTLIPDLNNIVQVNCQDYSTGFITGEGEVYFCGRGRYGPRGLETISYSPTKVPLLKPMKQIVLGEFQGLLLSTDGEVYSWGKFLLSYDKYQIRVIPEKIPDLPPMKQIGGGKYHNVGLTTEGQVYIWANKYSGIWGQEINKSGHIPTRLPDINKVVYVAADEVTALICQD